MMSEFVIRGKMAIRARPMYSTYERNRRGSGRGERKLRIRPHAVLVSLNAGSLRPAASIQVTMTGEGVNQ